MGENSEKNGTGKIVLMFVLIAAALLPYVVSKGEKAFNRDDFIYWAVVLAAATYIVNIVCKWFPTDSLWDKVVVLVASIAIMNLCYMLFTPFSSNPFEFIDFWFEEERTITPSLPDNSIVKLMIFVGATVIIFRNIIKK